MGSYKHYRNNANPGATLFITTTVLDFVHAFRREEMREAMVQNLARQCKLAKVALHAYVVMPHHIHMLVRLPEALTGPSFMRAFKANTSAALRPLLTESEVREFDQQLGLNRRRFWMNGYRSIEVEDEQMLWQKMSYVHLNPVRAGYVEDPDCYPWSSAQLVSRGEWSEEHGLPIQAVVSLGT